MNPFGLQSKLSVLNQFFPHSMNVVDVKDISEEAENIADDA
jgi:hypothetical protein